MRFILVLACTFSIALFTNAEFVVSERPLTEGLIDSKVVCELAADGTVGWTEAVASIPQIDGLSLISGMSICGKHDGYRVQVFKDEVWHVDCRQGGSVIFERTVPGPLAQLRPPVKSEKKEEVEQSFFQKYWMFIVPLLLVLMLGGGGQ
ncbi:hypothetical protein V1511DRAFT_505873 [Dipodascopsis uninucleata]